MPEEFERKKRFVRYKEGAKLYGLCQSTFEKRAKEAGATYKIGKAVIVDCEIFEEYLQSFRKPPQVYVYCSRKGCMIQLSCCLMR